MSGHVEEALDPSLSDTQLQLNMDPAFGDMLGDVDDLLIGFGDSHVAFEETPFDTFGSARDGGWGAEPAQSAPAAAAQALHTPALAQDAVPSPSSSAGAHVAADIKLKRKAEQNRCSTETLLRERGNDPTRRVLPDTQGQADAMSVHILCGRSASLDAT